MYLRHCNSTLNSLEENDQNYKKLTRGEIQDGGVGGEMDNSSQNHKYTKI